MFIRVLLYENKYIKNNELKKIIEELFEKSKYKINRQNIFFEKEIYDESEKQKEIEKICIMQYEIRKLKHINKENYFIHIEFFLLDDFKRYKNNQEENFQILLDEVKEIRQTIRKNIKSLYPDKYKILQDELSLEILKKSYPLIYEIENNLRELIYLTMTILSEKKDWYKLESPENLYNEVPENRKDKDIYGTDFKHLSQFLFERNQKGKAGRLFEKIEQIEECNEKELKRLKQLVPISNWNKYFKNLLIDDKTIEKIKKEFYKNEKFSYREVIEQLLNDINRDRNKVAHNDIDIDNDFYENLERKKYYFDLWIISAKNYILEKNKQLMLKLQREKINEINKKQTESINKLLEFINKEYNYSLNDIYDVIRNYTIEQEEIICINLATTKITFETISENQNLIRVIKKLNYLLSLKNQIENEYKQIDEEDYERNLQDIEDIKNNLDLIFKKDIIENIEYKEIINEE